MDQEIVAILDEWCEDTGALESLSRKLYKLQRTAPMKLNKTAQEKARKHAEKVCYLQYGGRLPVRMPTGKPTAAWQAANTAYKLWLTDNPEHPANNRRRMRSAEEQLEDSAMDMIGKTADRVMADRHDPVNHPKHYTKHPAGIECIQVTEHMNFCCGNAVKYIWRVDDKEDPIEDLEKAIWYLKREIKRRRA